MNKINVLIVIIASFIFSNDILAQNIELTPFSGYTFRSSMNISGGEAAIEDGITNGLILDIQINESVELEMLYSRQETYATAYSYYLTDHIDSKAVTSYLLIGANRVGEITPDVFKYYVGLKIGAAALTSSNNKFDDVVKFGISFGGGIKYYLSDHIGLRIGANINAPVTGAGAGLWFSNQGSGVSVSTFSPIVQFNLQGGLIFAF